MGATKRETIERTYRLIENVPGHIVEVGVARGRNAVIFGHLIRLTGDDQEIDCRFEGIKGLVLRAEFVRKR